MTLFEELLYSKEFMMKTQDPYGKGLGIAEKFMEFGDVVMEKNLYETDGPERKCEIVFMLVKPIDTYSRLVVECEAKGWLRNGEGMINLNVRMFFRAETYQAGFASSVFDKFYIQRASIFRKKAAEDSKKITNFIEKLAVEQPSTAQ